MAAATAGAWWTTFGTAAAEAAAAALATTAAEAAALSTTAAEAAIAALAPMGLANTAKATYVKISEGLDHNTVKLTLCAEDDGGSNDRGEAHCVLGALKGWLINECAGSAGRWRS